MKKKYTRHVRYSTLKGAERMKDLLETANPNRRFVIVMDFGQVTLTEYPFWLMEDTT